MTWYKETKYIESSKGFSEDVKNVLKTHPLPLKLMYDYHVPIDDINNHLEIEIADLEGRYAEGNGEKIRIDKEVANREDFIEKHFHYIMHEFFHWVKRRNEELFYFNDEEEVQSFTLNIAWEIMRDQSFEDINKVIWPIIKGHFDDEQEAKELYLNMCREAKDIVKIVGKHDAKNNKE